MISLEKEYTGTAEQNSEISAIGQTVHNLVAKRSGISSEEIPFLEMAPEIHHKMADLLLIHGYSQVKKLHGGGYCYLELNGDLGDGRSFIADPNIRYAVMKHKRPALDSNDPATKLYLAKIPLVLIAQRKDLDKIFDNYGIDDQARGLWRYLDQI